MKALCAALCPCSNIMAHPSAKSKHGPHDRLTATRTIVADSCGDCERCVPAQLLQTVAAIVRDVSVG
jgi:formate hydrogenlyase subunit 6/NADH:ubiquinone oxidoreductase subunit I